MSDVRSMEMGLQVVLTSSKSSCLGAIGNLPFLTELKLNLHFQVIFILMCVCAFSSSKLNFGNHWFDGSYFILNARVNLKPYLALTNSSSSNVELLKNT